MPKCQETQRAQQNAQQSANSTKLKVPRSAKYQAKDKQNAEMPKCNKTQNAQQ